MYLRGFCCDTCADVKPSGLSGLARLAAAGTGAAIGGAIGSAYGGPIGGAFGTAIGGAFGGGGGGSGGGGESPSNIIMTDVTTTVSPQISPNFIQQDSPTNSPVNASTSQSIPNAYGGAGYPATMSPNYAPSPILDNMNVLIYGALAVVGVAIFMKRRNSAPPRMNYKRVQ